VPNPAVEPVQEQTGEGQPQARAFIKKGKPSPAAVAATFSIYLRRACARE